MPHSYSLFRTSLFSLFRRACYSQRLVYIKELTRPAGRGSSVLGAGVALLKQFPRRSTSDADSSYSFGNAARAAPLG